MKTNHTKSKAAMALVEEMRDMLNDIAASASILGASPFEAGPASRNLATKLHMALLEFEIELAAIGRHEFNVRR